jgi:hypothetical protein
MVYVRTKFRENRSTGSKAEITCTRTPQHGNIQNLLRFCSQDGKQAQSILTSQKKENASITNINRLILYRKIIAVY